MNNWPTARMIHATAHLEHGVTMEAVFIRDLAGNYQNIEGGDRVYRASRDHFTGVTPVKVVPTGSTVVPTLALDLLRQAAEKPDRRAEEFAGAAEDFLHAVERGST